MAYAIIELTKEFIDISGEITAFDPDTLTNTQKNALKEITAPVIDDALSTESKNAVENKKEHKELLKENKWILVGSLVLIGLGVVAAYGRGATGYGLGSSYSVKPTGSITIRFTYI